MSDVPTYVSRSAMFASMLTTQDRTHHGESEKLGMIVHKVQATNFLPSLLWLMAAACVGNLPELKNRLAADEQRVPLAMACS